MKACHDESIQNRATQPARGKRQDGIETVQSLDGGLLIHAENDGVRRRVQIEADDVGGLGFKIGVVADHVMAQPMRLETVATPDSGHRHMGGSQPLAKRRLLHWVLPSSGPRRVHSRIRASSLAAPLAMARPLCRATSPPMRAARNRPAQRCTYEELQAR